jgi:hypothetical protein
MAKAQKKTKNSFIVHQSQIEWDGRRRRAYPRNDGKPVIETKALDHKNSTITSQADCDATHRKEQANHSIDLRSTTRDWHGHVIN